MRRPIWIGLLVITAIWVLPTNAEIFWPSESDWVALRQGTNYYYDALDDANPASIDLIGTTDTYSAGYWDYVINGYSTNGLSLADAFMIRMRVGNDKKSFVWQALLDTDGVSSSVEWILELVQSGGEHAVKLVPTTTGGPTIDDVSFGTNNAAWLGDLSGFSRWSTNSPPYYQVDFAIPWSDFSASTGVTNVNQIRVVLATSTTHSGVINGDFQGDNIGEQISNVLSDNIPEPAVASLLIGAGGGILIYRRLFRKQPHTEDDSKV